MPQCIYFWVKFLLVLVWYLLFRQWCMPWPWWIINFTCSSSNLLLTSWCILVNIYTLLLLSTLPMLGNDNFIWLWSMWLSLDSTLIDANTGLAFPWSWWIGSWRSMMSTWLVLVHCTLFWSICCVLWPIVYGG